MIYRRRAEVPGRCAVCRIGPPTPAGRKKNPQAFLTANYTGWQVHRVWGPEWLVRKLGFGLWWQWTGYCMDCALKQAMYEQDPILARLPFGVFLAHGIQPPFGKQAPDAN